jgi:large subunit ribosomal protein L22
MAMNNRHKLKIEKALERKKIIKSSLRNYRACPNKVRIVANTVVGLNVDVALNILRFGLTKPSKLLFHVLKSAVTQAERVFLRDVDNLVVEAIAVDQARTLKRYHPVSHGVAKPILKRSCHITVQVIDAKESKRVKKK